MEENRTTEMTLKEAVCQANKAFDGAVEVRWAEDENKLVFALPKAKVALTAAIKGLLLLLLIVGIVTYVLPVWLDVILLFFLGWSCPFYETYHRTVIDIQQKNIQSYWGYIPIKEYFMSDYDKMLVYCLSVNGSSPIPEDFCLTFKESGKRKELLVTHIGSKDAAKTSAIKEAVVSLFQLVLRDCGIDGWENETPECRLIHRNSIHR